MNQSQSNSIDSSIKTKEIIERATAALESIARGNFSNKYEALSDQDKCLLVAFRQITNNLQEVVKQINLIAQGRYDVDFVPLNENDELGMALSDMTLVLREMSNEIKKSAWIKSGQAELANVIRGDQDSTDLGKKIIRFMARYINALVGTIYQVATDEKDVLELIGSFAISKKKKIINRIKFGEGLIGQCALEKEQCIFSGVPKDYMTISSSLGEVAPKYIIVVPFLIEKEIVGVMELGSLETFDQTKIELLRQVSESIAIALKSSQNNKKLKILSMSNPSLTEGYICPSSPSQATIFPANAEAATVRGEAK